MLGWQGSLQGSHGLPVVEDLQVKHFLSVRTVVFLSHYIIYLGMMRLDMMRQAFCTQLNRQMVKG